MGFRLECSLYYLTFVESIQTNKQTIQIKKDMSNDYKFQYMMLSRLQGDCLYFLGCGSGSVKSLCYDSIEEHITEMKKLWNILPTDGKPEWLSLEEIEKFEKDMTDYVSE